MENVFCYYIDFLYCNAKYYSYLISAESNIITQIMKIYYIQFCI